MTERGVIVLAGQPEWAATLARLAGQQGFDLVLAGDGDLIARLVDARADLLVIDGACPEWRTVAVLPRSSPATRRIATVVVSTDPAVYAQADDLGLAAVLSLETLAAGLPGVLAQHARGMDPALAARLACQCQEPLPPEALEGIRKFNAGEYYRQHDIFEALWMAERGPVRTLYQGILQVGVAYYQIERGNRLGALRMLLRSRQRLVGLPDVCRGVDVRRLLEDSARVRAALEQAGDLAGFDRSLLQPVRLVEATDPADPA